MVLLGIGAGANALVSSSKLHTSKPLYLVKAARFCRAGTDPAQAARREEGPAGSCGASTGGVGQRETVIPRFYSGEQNS
jgi:hypothetical protein